MEKESSTQNFVPVKDIRDGVVILENGQLCSLLLASSINFSLKSTTEQEAILAGFQSFLNTLDFSLQVYVQSRRMDIGPYLELLSSREAAQYNDLMRIQLREYMDFVRTFTEEADIMTKNFFVVIPYGTSRLDTKGIRSLLGRKRRGESLDLARFEEDKTQLEQRVGVVENGLARIGVKTIPLGTDEVIELFYHLYNPEETTSAPSR